MAPDHSARRSLSVTKEISPPGPTVVASDEFANVARPIVDWKVFLVFLGLIFVDSEYIKHFNN